MKKLFTVISLLIFPSFALAQSPADSTPDDHTAREETEGKEIWENLQDNKLECRDLSDENYVALGEYFMGQAIGDTQRHSLMNQMMTSMMGEEGEKQMHLAMGKRFSGCDMQAPYSQEGRGLIPMMGSGWSGMMSGWNGFGIFSWLSMILFWILLILGVIALIRYLAHPRRDKEDKTPLDILKERYARGEIDKKEFEEKKTNLS